MSTSSYLNTARIAIELAAESAAVDAAEIERLKAELAACEAKCAEHDHGDDHEHPPDDTTPGDDHGDHDHGTPGAIDYDLAEPKPVMPQHVVNGHKWPADWHGGQRTSTVSVVFTRGADGEDASGKPTSDGPIDRKWAHLHKIDGVVPLVTVGLIRNETTWTLPLGHEIRWYVRGVPIGNWSPSSSWTIASLAEFDALPLDGVFDIQFELRGPDANRFKVSPAFVHLHRHDGRKTSPWVPVFGGSGWDGQPVYTPVEYVKLNADWKPPTFTIDPGDAPAFTEVNPDKLFVYPVGVVTKWSQFVQVPCVEPSASPHAGLLFSRVREPKHSESVHDLHTRWRHGAWLGSSGDKALMSGYTGGFVDENGDYVFAETNGRIGVLAPDGIISTLDGWSNLGPGVWPDKSISATREQARLIGLELKMPLDVAMHLTRGYAIADYAANEVVLQSFIGTTKRIPIRTPHSLSFSKSGRLLVCAMEEHKVIEIHPDGTTTVLMDAMPGATIPANASDSGTHQAANRVRMLANPMKTFLPQWVRWMPGSDNAFTLAEICTGCIRRLFVGSKATQVIETTSQAFGGSHRGWLSFDISDGTCGPLDTIYWCQSVGDQFRGEVGRKTNSLACWIPYDASTTIDPATGQATSPPVSRRLFGQASDNPLWGVLSRAACPHYPWSIACGKGRIYVGGMGSLNMVCIRTRQESDYVMPANLGPQYFRGGSLWAQTSAATVYGQYGDSYLYGRFFAGKTTDEIIDQTGNRAWFNSLSASDQAAVRAFLTVESKKN